MRENFWIAKIPEQNKAHVEAVEPSNGKKIDCWIQELGIEEQEQVMVITQTMINKYVPFEKRSEEPDKKAKPPIDFPIVPGLEPMVITETTCNSCVCLMLSQVEPVLKDGSENPDYYKFEDFVVMRKTAPTCFKAFTRKFREVAPKDDEEGNSPQSNEGTSLQAPSESQELPETTLTGSQEKTGT